MKTIRTLLVASHNAGKVYELRDLLAGIPLSLISLENFPNVDEVNETGSTFAETAALKATGYARQTHLLTIADDSGLEVSALGNKPGVFSARYAGPGASDDERTRKLLAELQAQSSPHRRARFCCSVAIADEEGNLLHISSGICEGKIADFPKGSGGFGFDPIFAPDGYDQTFAELKSEIKNQISHRARALVDAAEFLRSLTASLKAG